MPLPSEGSADPRATPSISEERVESHFQFEFPDPNNLKIYFNIFNAIERTTFF